jgi:hypothetical protein
VSADLTKAATGLVAKVRSIDGRKLAQRAITKQTQPPNLDVALLQKARSASGKMLQSEAPTAEELHALDIVIRKAAPKPKPDDTMLSIFANYRDGTTEEQQAIQKTLIEMGRIAREVREPTSLFKNV